MRSRRIIGWAVGGQLTFALSQFVMLAALARFATQADIGRFGLATAIITPIYWFSNLELRINQSTDVSSKYDFLDFLTLRLVTSLAAYCLIVVVAIVAVGDALTRTVLLIYGAARGAETISDLTYGVLQKKHEVRRLALSLFIRGTLGVGVFAALLWSGKGIAVSFAGFGLVWVFIAITWDLRIAWQMSEARLRPADWNKLMELFRESIPLGLSGLLAGLSGSAPRLAIAATLPLEALGQFTLATYVLQVATVAVSAIAQAVSSKLARFASDGREDEFRKLLIGLAASVAVVGLIGVAASFAVGDQVWRQAFGERSEPSPMLLAAIVAAATTRSVAVIWQTGLIAKRRFKDQAAIRLLVAVAMLSGSFLGVTLGGLTGVGMAMTLVSTAHAYTLWHVTIRTV